MKAALKHNHFLGDPCPKGHRGVRYKSNRHCVDCQSVKNRIAYEKYPDRQAQRSAQWRAENADREHDRYKLWAANNREKLKANRQRRDESFRAAEGFHTEADLNAIFDKQRGLCAYFEHCGKALEADSTRDHIVPLCRGGSNWPSNIQLTCPGCNARKGRKDPAKFEAELQASPPRALPNFPRPPQSSRP